jgi:hypothetical protein
MALTWSYVGAYKFGGKKKKKKKRDSLHDKIQNNVNIEFILKDKKNGKRDKYKYKKVRKKK